MPVGYTALLNSRKKVFDKLTGVFYPAGTEMNLLSQAANSANNRTWNTLLSVSSSWWFEYQEYRQQFKLEIADDSQDLKDAMAQATHIQIGNDDQLIYVIVTADTVPPLGVDVTWKIYCERFSKRGQFKSFY